MDAPDAPEADFVLTSSTEKDKGSPANLQKHVNVNEFKKLLF